MNPHHKLAIGILVSATFAACGGGGGTSPTPPTGGATTTSGGTPSSTASLTASPTAASTAASGANSTYTGTVVNTDAGSAPVGGATVTIGTSWTYQGAGYAISGVLATATTAPNGTFTIAFPNSATYVQVDANGLVSAHRPLMTGPNEWGVAPPANSFGTIGLPAATADDLTELAQFNSDRATLANGYGKLSLSLDADMELSARATTANEGANGYYAHTQPGTNYIWSLHYTCTILVGAFCANPIFQQENLGAGPGETVLQFEAGIIALGPGEGHYNNVMSQTSLFVGFGEFFNGKPDPQAAANGVTQQNYQAQEYLTTTDNPSP